MRQSVLLFLILIFTSAVSYTQTLKGKITGQSGDPIPYATVYIQELKQGTTANTKGDYEIRIPAGKYTIIYQSLGFEPILENITLSDNTITRNVILPLQYYQIPEVRISASGEDPAYIIMRKVIGMAPYYLNNVSYYKAEVYLKGNLVINRIPRLLKKSLKMETSGNSSTISGGGKTGKEEKVMKEGDSYLMESYNEIEFTAPEKYFQKVISYNSTFPEQGNEISPMSFIQASFYQPVLANMAISPLSPVAFSHYNFKYLGSSPQGNYTINKIEVIPRRKSQQLFEGTIYIIEDLWCLQSVDLTNDNLVGKIRIQQLYIPVEDNIWMPVSHKFDINIGIIGFKADVGYSSSVKYSEVRPNLALHKPEMINTDFSGKPSKFTSVADTLPVTKTKQRIDRILEKDQLSNRDMIKLARLMEKESERSIADSSKNNLEIKDNTTHVIEKDANRKDSAYWAQIRPIPLSDIEKHSLRVSDSIKAVTLISKPKNDSTISAKIPGKSKFFRTVKQITLGHTWSDTTGFRLYFSGLVQPRNLSFNTVDGFIYGMNFRISISWKGNKSFSVSPDIRWAFNREQLMWKVNSYYKFNGLKQNQLYLRTGMTSTDISNVGSINTFLNSITTLFLRKNYLKLYESNYVSLGYMSELINGLNLELRTTYEYRRVLNNTTDFSVFKPSAEYTENIPANSYLDAGSNPLNALRNQRHADFLARVAYTPNQKYRIYKGNKSPAGSEWPTFSFTWQHGINQFSELEKSIRQFDMLTFEAAKRKDMGAFNEFRWRIRTGGFIDNRYVPFYDFIHINSQPFPILLNNYEDAFMLPDYYSMTTPEFFGEAHLKYTTPYLLIKLLPGLSNTLMRENLSLSYLGTRYHQNYTEIGYSISEFLFIGEIGVYAGFNDLKYHSIGGKLVLRFN
jgi:hypothetical protein